jgi:hypothetical protein
MRAARMAFTVFALSLPGLSQAYAQGEAPLQNGTYNCISGYTFMLTLGEMTIKGNTYRFHPPEGPDTTGTFSHEPGRLTWSGDIGVIKNAQIVASDRDAAGTKTDVFWFQYNSDPTTVYTVSCKL